MKEERQASEMFWLRSCPRCQGDFYQDLDPFGYYLRCLQCGHEIQLVRRVEDQEQLSPTLLDEVRVTADAARLLAEGGRGRPGRHRKALKVA